LKFHLSSACGLRAPSRQPPRPSSRERLPAITASVHQRPPVIRSAAV
jgi:hypothetical protein